ncbi:hypothetical protein QFZ55_004786 [Streptomyces luteogriseus]|nr:hypothetical protein [Streptomyces luteogriseus]
MWRSWSPSESSMSFRAGSRAGRPISDGDCATVDRSNQSASGLVVEARDRDAFGHRDLCPAQVPDEGDGDLVLLGEDGGQRLAQAQQRAERLGGGALAAGPRGHHQVVVERHTRLGERLLIAKQAPVGAEGEAARAFGRDEGDPAMAEVEQVPGAVQGAGDIVDVDARTSVDVLADVDHRHAAVVQPGRLLLGEVEGEHQERVGVTAGREVLEERGAPVQVRTPPSATAR